MTEAGSTGKPFWAKRKTIGLILVIVIVVAVFVSSLLVYRPIQLAVGIAPDFKISTTTPENGPAGSTETTQLSITAVNGFNSPTSYSLHAATGLNCQVTGSSYSLRLGSTLYVDCTSNSAGVFLLTITVTSGSLSHVSTVSFTFASPASVTVEGKAQVTADIASEVKFAHGNTFTIAFINSVGNYTTSLPNFESYNVTIENSMQGACNVGLLSLRQNSTDPVLRNYSCVRLQYPTVTHLVCDQNGFYVNVTLAQCSAVVVPGSTYQVIPSGQVTFTLSDPRFTLENPTCTLLGGMNSAYCMIEGRVISNLSPNQFGNLFVEMTANYTGDSTDQASQASLSVPIGPPPTTVTVSGKATSNTVGSHATGLEFVSGKTGTVYKVIVKSGNYTLPLPNLQSYTVTLFYTNALGTLNRSCSAGTLLLQTQYATATENYQC